LLKGFWLAGGSPGGMLRVVIAQVFQYPVGHFAPEMKGGIIQASGNPMVFVGIIGAFKIHIAFYQRLDHLHAVLKKYVIISRTMDEQVFAFDPVGEIDR
jgi:hypothetical protein